MDQNDKRLNEIKEKFLEIIEAIALSTSGEESLTKYKEEALHIITTLKEKNAINEYMHAGLQERKMTPLGLVIYADCKTYSYIENNSTNRINNPILLELEQLIKDAGGHEANLFLESTGLGCKLKNEIIKKPDGKIVRTSEVVEGLDAFKGQKQVVEINPNDKNLSGKMSNITLKGHSSQKELSNP